MRVLQRKRTLVPFWLSSGLREGQAGKLPNWRVRVPFTWRRERGGHECAQYAVYVRNIFGYLQPGLVQQTWSIQR